MTKQRIQQRPTLLRGHANESRGELFVDKHRSSPRHRVVTYDGMLGVNLRSLLTGHVGIVWFFGRKFSLRTFELRHGAETAKHRLQFLRQRTVCKRGMGEMGVTTTGRNLHCIENRFSRWTGTPGDLTVPVTRKIVRLVGFLAHALGVNLLNAKQQKQMT